MQLIRMFLMHNSNKILKVGCTPQSEGALVHYCIDAKQVFGNSLFSNHVLRQNKYSKYHSYSMNKCKTKKKSVFQLLCIRNQPDNSNCVNANKNSR